MTFSATESGAAAPANEASSAATEASSAADLAKIVFSTDWANLCADDRIFQSPPLNQMPHGISEILGPENTVKLCLAKFSRDQLIYIAANIDTATIDNNYEESPKRNLVENISQAIMQSRPASNATVSDTRHPSSPFTASSLVSLSPMRQSRR